MDNKAKMMEMFMESASQPYGDPKFVWRIETPIVRRVAFDECVYTYGEEEIEDLLKAAKNLYIEQEHISEPNMTDMKYHGYIMGHIAVNDGFGYYILCDDNINRAAQKVKFLN